MSQTKLENEAITFSFGENWSSYLNSASDEALDSARKTIADWLGENAVAGKTVLDIGSGSGIHSLGFFRLGAKEIFSLDLDPQSVATTRSLWEKIGGPSNWKVVQGSILDPQFVGSIKQHDIVYSWGVLHHTGSLWQAMENAASLVAPGGRFCIAIYVKGPKYPEHLAQKQAYNRASKLGKKIMVWKYIYGMMRDRRRAGLNPFGWNTTDNRGMNVYHDIIDWLGGLPYEVASKDEVVDFCGSRGFTLERIAELGEQGNNTYLFSRTV